MASRNREWICSRRFVRVLGRSSSGKSSTKWSLEWPWSTWYRTCALTGVGVCIRTSLSGHATTILYTRLKRIHFPSTLETCRNLLISLSRRCHTAKSSPAPIPISHPFLRCSSPPPWTSLTPSLPTSSHPPRSSKGRLYRGEDSNMQKTSQLKFSLSWRKFSQRIIRRFLALTLAWRLSSSWGSIWKRDLGLS